MNNIKNSIRHLQSSIDKRGSYISSLTNELITLRSISVVFTKVSYMDKNYKLYVKKSIRELVKEISDSSKQQKVEKKMLAMMLSLNRMQYSKNNTVKSTCEYLDNL